MAAKRKKKAGKRQRGKRARARRKKPAPAPKKRRRRLPAAKRPDWRSPTSRRSIRGALAKVAGSLADLLTRVPLLSEEGAYLRGIASVVQGRRVTRAQGLALLAAMRAGSPLFRSVFGKREAKIVQRYRDAQDALALKKDRATDYALGNLLKGGKVLFYRSSSGVTQRWSRDGLLRFMNNPVYKLRRKGVFASGTFWIAKPDPRTRGLPKKGKLKFPVH